jgi:hypothetical protein
MIGSAKDKKTIIIEKKPDKTDIYDTGNDLIISTNHFLKNKAPIQEESSVYRFDRVNEMISGKKGMKVDDVADILRDMNGKNGADIGKGNEKTINQLLAHHSIIFKPEDLIVWVSTSPYQFGKYAAYDLKKVFSKFAKLQKDKEINEFDKQIGESRVLITKQFSDAMEYKRLTGVIKSAISNRNVFADAEIDLYVKTNQQMYLVYQLVGDYYYSRNDFVNAKKYYSTAMTKEIARLSERKKIEESILKCDEKK